VEEEEEGEEEEEEEEEEDGVGFVVDWALGLLAGADLCQALGLELELPPSSESLLSSSSLLQQGEAALFGAWTLMLTLMLGWASNRRRVID